MHTFEMKTHFSHREKTYPCVLTLSFREKERESVV